MNAVPDVVELAPEFHQVVFENRKIRVIKATLPPGKKLEQHQHPKHIVIIVKGSLLQISEGGELKKITAKDGFVHESEPVIHSVENIGDVTIDEYLIEFKNK